MSLRESALKLLGRRKNGLTAREIIEALEQRGLWASPNGQTPVATLQTVLRRGSEFKRTVVDGEVLWTKA